MMRKGKGSVYTKESNEENHCKLMIFNRGDMEFAPDTTASGDGNFSNTSRLPSSINSFV